MPTSHHRYGGPVAGRSRVAESTEAQRLAAAEERRAQGWREVEAALSAADADEAITVGRWAGFSRGVARAWCWNLFQYEPRGFVHPGTQVRHEAMQELLNGGIPEVFGYPERARKHADRGLNPRSYRVLREALGSGTFTPADVSHG